MKSLLFLAFAASAFAADFQIERAPNPPNIDPQIGGVDVLPDGRVVAVFHRGEVMIYDPADQSWQRFAEGLHEPLGVIAESPQSLLVMQRAELTRLRDEDGDGTAEIYQTVFDDFGMTGNYHEFAFGPAQGPDGSLYIGLNLASNGAGVRPEVRGEWSEIGQLDREAMVHDGNWGQRSEKAGRMYSRTPWRGWILKISPDGKSMEPFAMGFRSPNGLGFDANGNLLVTDNEGDWRGTSPLYVVKKGGFYGHPASLVWQENWREGDPRMLPVDRLDKRRTLESGRFPQGDLANSPTQPIVFPESWGPYAGQVLIGEMNQKRMVRFLADDVDGFRQGALIPIFDGTEIGNGNHRLAFAPDGTLWVGKTHLSWAGAKGLWNISPPEKTDDLFTVTSTKLVKHGRSHALEIRFSQPIDPALETTPMERYTYHYHQPYGSPKVDRADVSSELEISDGGRLLRVAFNAKEGFVHRVDLGSVRSPSGAELEGKVLYYQATKLP